MLVGVAPAERPNIPVTFEDVSKAAHDIRGAVYVTPCARNPELSELTGCNLWLKAEYKQHTGSFKERGARNALLQLSPEQKKKGVIAASAGNHALGLAYHSKLLGIPVTVVMPTTAPITKVDKCRKLGANVILKGMHIGEAKDFALADPQFAGMRYINGYDDPAIIAGAGSLGLEILDQVPDVDVVVVPVGGAGLIAGVALAIKTVRPDVLVIGVEPERCASYTAALAHGSPTPAAVSPTLADGLAVPCVGPHAFEVARHFVDRVVTVSERQVALAVLRLIEHEKAVVEGGGAAGLAALLPGGPLDIPELKGKTVCTPLCGGNIDTSVLGRVLERGLAADRRLVRFVVTVSDRPGGLAKLTALISGVGASIWDISHERAWLQNSVDQVRNQVVVELTGPAHEDRLRAALEAEYGTACLMWGDEVDASVSRETKMKARYRE
jgi:threonine dehydratase